MLKLDKDYLEASKEEFQRKVDELDRVIKAAKLISAIEHKSRGSEKATPEELDKISLQLKAYHEQLRLLDDD